MLSKFAAAAVALVLVLATNRVIANPLGVLGLVSAP
jgi:hypothetical protein